jgi:hypothetical protein
MANALSRLRDHLAGSSVDLVGNGPTASEWRPRPSVRVVTVNAGLKLMAEHDAMADLYWVQDERFIATKPESLLPYLSRTRFFAANADVAHQAGIVDDRLIPIRMLDYETFSRDPRIGLGHGYNVIFGALQILRWCGVRRIDVFGVGLRYWSTDTRFDQRVRGFDVDLHRSGDQVRLVRHALDIVEADGIEIQIHGASALSVARTATL